LGTAEQMRCNIQSRIEYFPRTSATSWSTVAVGDMFGVGRG
jgi:hypothetical protein